MLANFTLKDRFYNVRHTLSVDNETKYASYHWAVDNIISTPQNVDFLEVSTLEKASAWLQKSPSNEYATRIEYLHAFQHGISGKRA